MEPKIIKETGRMVVAILWCVGIVVAVLFLPCLVGFIIWKSLGYDRAGGGRRTIGLGPAALRGDVLGLEPGYVPTRGATRERYAMIVSD
jgi:hypothetical protein